MPAKAADKQDPHAPRHARHRHRRPLLVTGALVAVTLVAAAGVVALLADRTSDRADQPAARQPATGRTTGPAAGPAAAPRGARSTDAVAGPECRYPPAPGEDIAPQPPARAALTGTVRATLRTNRGPITMELDATRAPCTVNSFVSLARGDYFIESSCHRLTTAGIFVLQCGDPTATGSGTPGYRFDDENLPAGAVPAYPRGTLAMANAGPHTNGSQFFMVYRDSDIDPNYPIFGRITEGLHILDEVSGGGAAGGDGPPNLELIIEAVEVTP
jgi:peptidyl-prolyl cis-trans isomerase B (cyclophilin B)